MLKIHCDICNVQDDDCKEYTLPMFEIVEAKTKSGVVLTKWNKGVCATKVQLCTRCQHELASILQLLCNKYIE